MGEGEKIEAFHYLFVFGGNVGTFSLLENVIAEIGSSEIVCFT